MDLLLWRHAEAVDGLPDHDRALTPRGREQAQRMAAWIEAHRPRKLRVLASPTVRTRQTASALCKDFELLPKIGPDASVADLIAASGWPDASGNVLLIGHQPALGQLASLLIAGQEADWTVKKGALWWITNRSRAGETQNVLRAVLPANLI